ncbi:MAG TPA: recombinase family protein [Oligoflexus sp.]|uniref:recombinase family protein n=1 Tax=Oligoflexus sp. TaxID=1971216 RepID=UPI002D6F7DA9|nr:recombinase family protein [Oligoflexus sp.]HYX38475.1 recombinase family protein [Oligoflexus sp.]
MSKSEKKSTAENLTGKLNQRHLDRLAFVYVRQSSPQQVIEHKESTALQYALVQRATSLGWKADRVIVIDDDQGCSAQSSVGRVGFQRLLAEIGLDHAGIILGLEMSRLARSCKDWHHLLELCALFQTLLADQDGLYDPTNYNDRLLLGLKGAMSEAELHILHGRLRQGRWNKARRGELFNHPPIGYVRSPSGELILDPDEQVQSIVRLIFEKFDELKSLNGLLQYLTRNEIRIGIRPHYGLNRGNIEWRPPNRATLQGLLHHPVYAGAYRYGYRPVDPRAKIAGRPATGRKIRTAEDCEVLLKDRLPSYISWERYLDNQKRLEENRARASFVGASRQGCALLCGILTCGICGGRMSVVYLKKDGLFRYYCGRDYIDYGKKNCQSFTGNTLDRLVAEQVLEAIKPASLDLSLAACEHIEKEQGRILKDWHQRLERAEYEVSKASRYYHSVDPENRLVARELERKWEDKLAEQETIKEEYERFVSKEVDLFTEHDRNAIRELAANIPAVWDDPATSNKDRQEIVRILLKQVIAKVDNGTENLSVHLRWNGDVFTYHNIKRPVARYDQMEGYQELMNRIIELYDQGKTTESIATHINQEGWHPPKRAKKFSGGIIASILSRKRKISRRPKSSSKEALLGKNEWWLDDFARAMEIPKVTIYSWATKHGWIQFRQLGGKQGRIIVWADEKEMIRLNDLRAWLKTRSWSTDNPPSHLTSHRQKNKIKSSDNRNGQDHENTKKRQLGTHQDAR